MGGGGIAEWGMGIADWDVMRPARIPCPLSPVPYSALVRSWLYSCSKRLTVSAWARLPSAMASSQRRLASAVISAPEAGVVSRAVTAPTTAPQIKPAVKLNSLFMGNPRAWLLVIGLFVIGLLVIERL